MWLCGRGKKEESEMDFLTPRGNVRNPRGKFGIVP